MKTNRIFHYGYCLLLSMYPLNSQENDFTIEEKAQAKKSILESFYKDNNFILIFKIDVRKSHKIIYNTKYKD